MRFARRGTRPRHTSTWIVVAGCCGPGHHCGPGCNRSACLSWRGCALVRVLPGTSPNVVRVLVPDDRAALRGFHALLIEDLSATKVSCTVLRQHWPPSLLSVMTKRQVDMEAQCRECKRQFGNLRPGKCPHCGTYINTSLSRHVMSFHLNLGQLWRCPIPWCSVCKGTAQDCMDHLRLRHHTGSSVKSSMLGKCFPPWTVTHSAWASVSRVSGIATDVMLFSQHGARLIHRYRVFADSVPQQSLRGSFMMKLSGSPARPLQRPARRTSVAGIIVRSRLLHLSDVFRHLCPHSGLYIAHRTTPLRPGRLREPRPQLRRRPKPRPMLLLLYTVPRWRLLLTCAPGPAPAPAQSPADEFDTLDCPSPPGSRTSTPPYELLSTHSDDATPVHAPPARKAVRASSTVTSTAGTSTVAPVLTQRVPRLQILDCHVPMSPAVGPVSPGLPRPTLKVSLPLPQSAVSVPFRHRILPSRWLTSCCNSAISISAWVPHVDPHLQVPFDWHGCCRVNVAGCCCCASRLIMARFEPLNLSEAQESWLSLVQLSPNRVRTDFDVDSEDLYPLFDTSPVSDGDLSLISPATIHESISTDSEGKTESFHIAGVSPATSASMSTTYRTAELQLLSPPPAPLPSSIQVETDSILLFRLATAYHKWLSQPVPVSSPSLFREGPFDAATCPAATTEHPLIANQRDDCPYRSGLRTLACGHPIWFAGPPSTIPGVGGGAGVCSPAWSATCRVAPDYVQGAYTARHTPAAAWREPQCLPTSTWCSNTPFIIIRKELLAGRGLLIVE